MYFFFALNAARLRYSIFDSLESCPVLDHNLGASRRRAKAPLINGHAGGKGTRVGRIFSGKAAEKVNLH